MKTTIFTKSLRVLIVTMLLLAVSFGRNTSQYLMIGAGALWLLFIIGSFFSPKILKALKRISATIQSMLAEKQEEYILKPLIPESPPLESQTQESTEKLEKCMLQHISLRISEKIKSAYPDATWRWETEPSLQAILDGKTARIIADGMNDYTHADIRFDQFARIRITPLVVGEFASVDTPAAKESNQSEKEPPVVDVISWYELIGRQILENTITDLNANGHSKLVIKENGDIVINRNKKEALQATLEQFPPKNYWEELVSLLEEYDLKSKIDSDHIALTWM